ncbi:hypothetical protein DFQ27_005565 [Actinomortierella ambigua]|uniref:F-box domain-containing protein n=1 Tax=Actinomortierella ambigua TaxID=1343610 RepID=A0A9P6UDF9_9FUNG|nr:hypothetical protein DFQ27_005565 [Actinomortierella ambigua]
MPQSGPRLPIEVLETIISHVKDPATLFSLLTVSSSVFDLAVRQLYFDPFQILVRRARKGRASDILANGVSLLRTMLLLLSPYEDVATMVALRCLGFVRDAPPSISASCPDSTITIPVRIQSESSDEERQQQQHQHHHQQQQDSITLFKYRVNYLRFIRVFDFSIPWDLLSRWYYTPSLLTFDDRNEFGETLGDLYSNDRTHALFHTSITWALVGHQLPQIVALHLPVHDIERYIEHVSHFCKLQDIVFDMDTLDMGDEHLRNETNAALNRRTMGRCVDFVRLLSQQIVDMLNKEDSKSRQLLPRMHRPRSITASFYYRKYYHDNSPLECEFTPLLYEALPPLYKPKFLTSLNWERFLCKANKVDLAHVEHVRVGWSDEYAEFVGASLYMDAHTSWPILERKWGHHFAPRAVSRFLQACRSLRRLETEIEEDNFFDWAVEEKIKAEESTAARRMRSPVHMEEPPPTTPRSVRLAHVSLLCTPEVTLGIVNDTMRAFDLSIETVKFKSRHQLTECEDEALLPLENDSAHSHPPTTILGGGIDSSPWILPRLRKLQLESLSTIQLHPTALDHCPQLEVLHLVDPDASFFSFYPRPFALKTGSSSSREDADDNSGIKRYNELHEADGMPPPLLPAWNNLPALQELILVGKLTLAFHPHTLRTTPRLKKLVIRGPTVRTQGCQPAKEVTTNNNNITPPPVAASSPNHWTWDWTLPSLRHLELEGPRMSDFELVLVLQHQPRLQVARLVNRLASKRLFSETNTAHSRNDENDQQQASLPHHHHHHHHQHHRHLRSLTLSGAWRVTDDDIGRLANTLTPRLAHLALQKGCKGFTPEGFVSNTAKSASTMTFRLGECQTPVLHRAKERALGLERRPPAGPAASASLWARVPTKRSEFVLWEKDEEEEDEKNGGGGGGDRDDDDNEDDDGWSEGIVIFHEDMIDSIASSSDQVVLDFPVYNFGGTQFRLK